MEPQSSACKFQLVDIRQTQIWDETHTFAFGCSDFLWQNNEQTDHTFKAYKSSDHQCQIKLMLGTISRGLFFNTINLCHLFLKQGICYAIIYLTALGSWFNEWVCHEYSSSSWYLSQMAVTHKEWSVVIKQSRGTDAVVGTVASYLANHIFDTVSVRTFWIHGASIQINCVKLWSIQKIPMPWLALHCTLLIKSTELSLKNFTTHGINIWWQCI